jgi:PAS domain S-box-containing protein
MGEVAQTRTLDTQLFHDVFDASPIGIAVENLDGQPLFVNPAFCSFLDFNEEELRNKHSADFSPREDVEKDWALFQQLKAASIDHYQLEKRYFRKDGSMVWGRLSISLLSSHPSPLVIAMVDDITDKKRAEEARFRHAAIVEPPEDAIISKNRSAVITSWDAGAERIFGYAESEAMGQPITILIPPELQDEENKILEKVKAGERIEHYETIRATKTGRKVAVSLSISPIEDSSGNIMGFTKIARDITQRQHAEEALRASEELLRVFVKNVPAAVAMLDRDMRYLQVSDRWCTDYLSGRAQVLGRSHYEIFPDMPDRWKEVHRRALQGETLRADEDRWDGQDGAHWARWEVRPWKTAEGAVGGILILAEDITRRKQMEEALSDLSRKLIESQEQERARIGRELHDDINQRLAILGVELEQLQENPSEVQSRVQDLQKQTTELSNDVQALSHDLHSSKLEYLGVVAGIRSWCKEFAERQKVEIDFTSDVSSVLPLQVGLSLFRVLQEALNNAIKHSGGKRIEVQLRQDSGETHLLISDLGRGFDVEAASQGKGLGLTSMRERVRLVNGTICIASKPMGGTTIHVRVPLTSAKGAQREVV